LTCLQRCGETDSTRRNEAAYTANSECGIVRGIAGQTEA